MITYRDPYGVKCCVECGKSEDLCQCEDVEAAIHSRLHSLEGKFQRRVLTEIDTEKYDHTYGLFNQLTFNIGTLARQLPDHKHDDNATGQEILQTTLNIAALATIIGTEGDELYPYDPSILFGQE